MGLLYNYCDDMWIDVDNIASVTVEDGEEILCLKHPVFSCGETTTVLRGCAVLIKKGEDIFMAEKRQAKELSEHINNIKKGN